MAKNKQFHRTLAGGKRFQKKQSNGSYVLTKYHHGSFVDLFAQNQSFKIEPIQPASSPTFLYTSNPLYGGTFAFKNLCESEEVGISLQNYRQSLFFAAHLYYALKQSELVKTHWIEMDELIDSIKVSGSHADYPRQKMLFTVVSAFASAFDTDTGTKRQESRSKLEA